MQVMPDYFFPGEIAEFTYSGGKVVVLFGSRTQGKISPSAYLSHVADEVQYYDCWYLNNSWALEHHHRQVHKNDLECYVLLTTRK